MIEKDHVKSPINSAHRSISFHEEESYRISRCPYMPDVIFGISSPGTRAPLDSPIFPIDHPVLLVDEPARCNLCVANCVSRA